MIVLTVAAMFSAGAVIQTGSEKKERGATSRTSPLVSG